MTMRLVDFLRRNASVDPRPLVAMTLIGALSTLIVLALISLGAVEARSHDPGLRMLAIFLAAVGLYVASQNSAMSGAAREAEQIIRRLRARLFDRIETADVATVQAIGRARLYAAMAHETQTLSRTVVILVIAAQQAVSLVLVALFLAWLTLPGFLAVAVLGSLAILIHVRRAGAMAAVTERAIADERALFDGFEHLLGGFKEVRVNARRGRRLIAEIDAASDRVQRTNGAAKRRWGIDFVVVQTMFYALMGLMVFAVPMFDSGFADVALEASTVALFMIGPIATIAQAIPAHAEDAQPLDAPIREIALSGASFTYREADGAPGFTVGPLDATFRAGEVVFVTGGNGSGKSTLLRLLTGLLRPDRGVLSVNGVPLAAGCRQAYRDRIAAVLSDYHLFRRLHGLSAVDPARVEALLDILELGDKVGVRDGAFTTVDLSGGQRKRLALLVAMLEDKPVLVLDEWAADQDPHFRRKFYEEILPSLQRPDRTIVCVTHDERYFSAADRVIDMAEGRIRINPPG